ncbi:TipC family immunity protein [Gemella morbillorum]|uniref:TipC family immunity protein n=1 Tax=Gemella morbillorum TaxID=29391 RepID=UPI0028D3ABDD|nr:TipC family immunity protein [Gemella morbillorum]
MKKLSKSWKIFIITTVVLIGSIYGYHKINNRNAFEEMYNSYYNFSLLGSVDRMGQLKPIQIGDKWSSRVIFEYRDNTETERKIIKLVKGDNVVVSGQWITIAYYNKVSDKETLVVYHTYDIESKVLSSRISFYREESAFSLEKEEKELLKKYNISKEYLQKKSDELLDTVLTDWQRYSGSSYSRSNMGRLTIEKEEILR